MNLIKKVLYISTAHAPNRLNKPCRKALEEGLATTDLYLTEVDGSPALGGLEHLGRYEPALTESISWLAPIISFAIGERCDWVVFYPDDDAIWGELPLHCPALDKDYYWCIDMHFYGEDDPGPLVIGPCRLHEALERFLEDRKREGVKAPSYTALLETSLSEIPNLIREDIICRSITYSNTPIYGACPEGIKFYPVF